MANEILVFVSCPEAIVDTIANSLIEEKLAACVSILPSVKSIYIWQEKICQEKENLLLIKSNKNCYAILEKRIKELHSYAVPEIIAISIESGYKAYLDWLNESLVKD